MQDNMNKLQNNHGERKKLEYSMFPLIENSRQCKLAYSNRKQIYGILGLEQGWLSKHGLQRGIMKHLGAVEMYSILIVVMVSRIPTYQILHLVCEVYYMLIIPQ